MPYENNVFKLDLRAIQRALERHDFDNLNIFSNRIMSNAYLLNGMQYALPGFIIKYKLHR
jgi:hypothetical protein